MWDVVLNFDKLLHIIPGVNIFTRGRCYDSYIHYPFEVITGDDMQQLIEIEHNIPVESQILKFDGRVLLSSDLAFSYIRSINTASAHQYRIPFAVSIVYVFHRMTPRPITVQLSINWIGIDPVIPFEVFSDPSKQSLSPSDLFYIIELRDDIKLDDFVLEPEYFGVVSLNLREKKERADRFDLVLELSDGRFKSIPMKSSDTLYNLKCRLQVYEGYLQRPSSNFKLYKKMEQLEELVLDHMNMEELELTDDGVVVVIEEEGGVKEGATSWIDAEEGREEEEVTSWIDADEGGTPAEEGGTPAEEGESSAEEGQSGDGEMAIPRNSINFLEGRILFGFGWRLR